MRWQDFIDEKKVKKTNKDLSKTKSLVNMSDNLIKLFSKIDIDESTSSAVFVNYYEALRQIVEAVATINGFKVYSHEALTSFLSEILKEDLISNKFDRFRFLRNGVNYYGEQIEVELSKESKTDILNIIKILKSKYLK